MCPIAEILFHEGYELTGSDRSESDTLDRIKGYGIPVFMGHKAENVEGTELVVYSAAVPKDNPELVAAREKGIPTVERSVMLRYGHSPLSPLSRCLRYARKNHHHCFADTDFNYGRSGSVPLSSAESSPISEETDVSGKSDAIVCEACEYVDTFLQLTPYLSVILNIDADHLDYFGTLDNIIRSFHQFALQTTGVIVAER